MTLSETICRAVWCEDVRLAGRVAKYMRFRLGWNYAQSAQAVVNACVDHRVCGESDARARWEGLLYAADTRGE